MLASLTHHWTFDETSGDIAGDVVGGNDGELRNWGTAEPKWVTGNIGGALNFSTADNSVITALPITQNQYTVAFWLNVTGRSGVNPRLVSPIDGRDGWVLINNEGNRGVGFYFRDTTAYDPTAPQFGVWEHYAVAYDTVGDVATIYRNGVQVASGSFVDHAPLARWVFGHNSDLGNHNDSLNGMLDDLRVYDGQLTAEEVAELAGMGGPPPEPEGLIHQWAFDETSGDTAMDSVGGNDGALQNWSVTEDKWTTGRIGGALTFADSNDLVITQSAITENQYTIAFWLNVSGQGGVNPRIAAPIDGRDGWVLLNNEGSRGVGFYFRDTSAYDPNRPTLNVWEHYAVAYDRAGGAATIYRNGLLVATGVFLDDAPLERWVFGHNSDVGNHNDTLRGKLDELRIYDLLLQPDEIKLLAGGVRLDDLALSDVEILEGESATISGSFTAGISSDSHGVMIDWGDGTIPTELTVEAGVSGFSADHVYADDPPGALDTYQITVTVLGSGTLSDQGSLDITVANVAPTVEIGGPLLGVSYQDLPFVLAANDPSTIDQAAGFTFQVDWNGDSVFDESLSGPSGTIAVHAFDTNGTYEIQVRATDKDGAVSQVTSHTVVIQDLAVADQVLLVAGTAGNDNIQFLPASNGGIAVVRNGQMDGPFGSIERIQAYGGPGDDFLFAAAGLTVPVLFSGGDGNDNLSGAGGNDVLLGGLGSDFLFGLGGRDLLIAGAGADSLSSNQGDDLLISGVTAWDRNQLALDAILAEWSSSRDYVTRVRNLTDGSGSAERENGNYFLVQDLTVLDDEEDDMLLGGPGLDWFFFDAENDSASDKTNEELVGNPFP